MPIKIGRDAKIAIGWGVCVFGGLYSFFLSKQVIDQKRYDNMKVRERIRNSNIGEYERIERFRKD